MKSIRQLAAFAPSIESHYVTVLAPDSPSVERPSASAQEVSNGLECSGDCFLVIPNRFPALNSANQPEKINAAKLLIYHNLAAFLVVAGARNHRDRHLIEISV